MPRSHIHGLDAGLATDTIRRNSWQSELVHSSYSYVVVLNHTYIVHPYRITEIGISWVIRGI